MRGAAHRRRSGCRSSSSTRRTSSARGDVYRSSTELVRRFLRREIPAYVDGALNIVDAEDVAARPPAGRRARRGRASATSSATATSRSTGSSPTSAGSAASSRRRSSCRCRRARAGARRSSALPGRPPITVERGARGVAVVGVPLDEGQARARLEARRTTRTRCEATIDWYREREPARLRGPARASRSPLRLAGLGAATRPAASWQAACPDGHGDALPLPHADRLAVPVRARRARAAPSDGVDVDDGARAVAPARPRRRSQALSGQRPVPLLVIDGEAICDSKRIVEHLRWRRAPTEAR